MDIYAYHYGIINKSYNNRGISNSYNAMSATLNGGYRTIGFDKTKNPDRLSLRTSYPLFCTFTV